jgi:hypothetical protein
MSAAGLKFHIEIGVKRSVGEGLAGIELQTVVTTQD